MTTLTALLLILLVLMIIVGGKTGFKSYLSVVINACLLILVALLISWGVNIVLVGAIFIPLKLLTIIYLGTHDYTVAKNAFLTALCAVSYTHLRAPEPGRHIVCRLLLVKKR